MESKENYVGATGNQILHPKRRIFSRRTLHPLALLTVGAISGCAGQFVPMQTIDKVGIKTILAAERIQIVSVEKVSSMTSIGEVVGHSCQNKVMVGESPSTKVGAIDQLRIVAAEKGATAITTPSCEEGGFSLMKNCWNSWECKSTAFREKASQ